MASLKDRTISGLFWSFLQKIGSSGISFVVMILLARLLAPVDFGLIGMLMIFIQISQAVVDGGFNLALIQKKETDEEDYSSVFFINLAVSFVLYFILFFTAPFIADFYSQPLLIELVRVLSLVFIFNAFSFVQEAKLTKEIKFKTLMLVNIPSTIFGGLIGVSMAFLGFGVWSIVALQLSTRLAYAIQIWLYSKWKPIFIFNIQRAKVLFSFGGKLFVSRVIGTIYNNVFLIVLGKFYPVSSVGYYQNANNLASVPASTIATVISGVTFSAFSEIQDDNIRLAQGYKRAIQQVFFWITPLYVLATVMAEPLFRFVFTEKWLPAVPYFQILCIVGVIGPLSTYNLNIVNVKGRSDIFLKLQLIRRSLTSIAIVFAVIYGDIMTLLIVQAASSVFAYVLFSSVAGRFINYGFIKQLKDLAGILFLSFFIGAIVLFIDYWIVDITDLLRLFIGFITGFSVYVMVVHHFKFESYIELKNIVQTKLFDRRNG